jgi:aspartate/methionine/tyrosine aminotransferase
MWARRMSLASLADRALSLERDGRRIVRLNVGNTNLPPPAEAVERAIRVLRENPPGHYESAAGSPELLRLIAEREGCGTENVVIGPGSKLLIWGLMSILCERGESLSTPAPYWPAYALAAESLGLRFRPQPGRLEDGWSFAAADLSGAGLFILCNPHNPTGLVLDDGPVGEIIERCGRQGIHLVIDEAYKGLAFRPIPRYKRAIRVRSFSKEFSLESWRLGYAVAPAAVVERLVSFISRTATCVPRFVQEAGIACLEGESGIRMSREAVWRSRSETLQGELAKRGFRFAAPGSGMYVFATRDDIIDSESFCRERLERAGIALAPGNAFGGYERFVRIAANQTEKVLEDAVAAIDGRPATKDSP